MTTTFRGILFGFAIAAALTVTLDTVTAAEPLEVVRLDRIEITAHRDAFDADGPTVVRLAPIVVTAHKDVL